MFNKLLKDESISFVVSDMKREWNEFRARVKARSPLWKRELRIRWRMYLLGLNVGETKMLTMDEYSKVR